MQSFILAALLTTAQAALPIVNLGYVQHQASSLDDTGSYYTFSNIAFARPPLGDLRFAAPVPPTKIRGVQNGNRSSTICPQAHPPWLAALANYTGGLDLTNTEDCLYLDVFVPKTIFDRQGKAPVLDLIYGGGLVIGSKETNDPRSLLLRSIHNTSSDGVIIVAANYRVGNFGTLGGSAFEAQGGASNIALLDQRMVIDWIQKYIHLFGGDVGHVTLMGESGGASSIAHQITGAQALGKGRPFSQVVMQSPAELLPNSDELSTQQFRTFLKQLNVTTLAAARKLDTSTLQKANFDLIQQFPYGTFPYSYNVDNRIVKTSARKSILQSCIQMPAFISYNLNEGFIFTPQDNTTFETYVREWLPSIRPDQFKHITTQLYPASAYPSTFARIDNFIADALIDCNSAAFEKGFDDQAYAYKFSVPTPGSPVPAGYHIQDLQYTYLQDGNPYIYEDIAVDMQTRFVNFAVHGDPNAAGSSPAMPRYGFDHLQLEYTADGFKISVDENAVGVNPRCKFWDEL